MTSLRLMKHPWERRYLPPPSARLRHHSRLLSSSSLHAQLQRPPPFRWFPHQMLWPQQEEVQVGGLPSPPMMVEH